MTPDEWKDLFERHPHWEVVDELDGSLVLWNRQTDRYYRIDPESDVTPQETEEVLEGLREPVELITITRIVGYYSQVETGWNKSKIGELIDRRKGNYSLPEKEAAQ